MIHFWADSHGTFTIREYVAQRGAPIASHFAIRSYEEITAETLYAPATHIFSAQDQLTPSQLELLRLAVRAVTGSAVPLPVLNHPDRVLFRAPLLRELARKGLNDFEVHSGAEWASVSRFPVFIRASNDHGGSLSRLLNSREELHKCLRALQLRGHSLTNLLVEEFCDTRDNRGQYRKYGAFKVGDAIVPHHMMISKEWMVKSDSHSASVESAIEELEYVESNPHAGWLEHVFETAGVDYGRIDYGVLDGRPQAWEINLNPTMAGRLGRERKPAAPEVRAIQDKRREATHSRLRAAFVQLDAHLPNASPILVTTTRRLVDSARAELARKQRRATFLASLGALSQSKWFGLPMRAVLHRMSPR